MRKLQQDQILDSIKIISEANNEIKKLLTAGNFNDTARLLIDISSLMEKIEEFITGIFGVGTQTAQLMDEFQTFLYQTYQGFEETGEMNHSICKIINKKLIQIENSVNSELRINRIEIVFIGSRPSTIDSFETVYQAAKSDPACDSYFIPMDFPKITQEDLDFYKSRNIDVTLYKDYDIEARHPDVVFIDYPYDEFGIKYAEGHSTFSEYLRKHCRLLAHVPYYLTTFENNRISTHVEYVMTSGVRNSNYVFMVSEKARKIAIKDFNDNNKKYGWNEMFGKAEQKFVALGTPKLDGFVNAGMKDNDYNIPFEWRKLLFKPDGTRKKVILYNSHFRKFADAGEKYINKAASVIELFKNNEDVVLWWRPHPSVEPTLRASDRNLYMSYLKLVDICAREGLAIHDTTPNFNRAVAMSDVLYGDSGSLFSIFLALGRIVLRQDIELIATRKEFSEGRKECFLPSDDITETIEMVYNESTECNIVGLIDFLTKHEEHEVAVMSEKRMHIAEETYGKVDGCAGSRIYNFCKSKLLK